MQNSKPNPSHPTTKAGGSTESGVARFGLALANWSERWFPDPLVFALAGVVVVFLFGLLHPSTRRQTGHCRGQKFLGAGALHHADGDDHYWRLCGGDHAGCLSLIRWLATSPKTAARRIAMIASFSMLTSLISWGLSLIFSGLLAREMAKRVKGMDYRAAGGAAYLGLGAVWALGLSSSAAMMMATKGAIPPSLLAISGLIPLGQTIFLWQSMLIAAVLIVVSVAIAYLSAPSAENAKTAEDYGIVYESAGPHSWSRRTKPGEWLEYSPLLTILVAMLLGWYLVDFFRTSPQGALAALDLNTYNLMFITVGLLLHWRPKASCGRFPSAFRPPAAC